jgi:hypothetical protein
MGKEKKEKKDRESGAVSEADATLNTTATEVSRQITGNKVVIFVFKNKSYLSNVSRNLACVYILYR